MIKTSRWIRDEKYAKNHKTSRREICENLAIATDDKHEKTQTHDAKKTRKVRNHYETYPAVVISWVHTTHI